MKGAYVLSLQYLERDHHIVRERFGEEGMGRPQARATQWCVGACVRKFLCMCVKLQTEVQGLSQLDAFDIK